MKLKTRVTAVLITLLVSCMPLSVQAAQITPSVFKDDTTAAMSADAKASDYVTIKVNASIQNGETKSFGNTTTGKDFVLHAGMYFDVNLFFATATSYFEYGIIDELGNIIPSRLGFVTQPIAGCGEAFKIPRTGSYKIYVTNYNLSPIILDKMMLTTFMAST